METDWRRVDRLRWNIVIGYSLLALASMAVQTSDKLFDTQILTTHPHLIIAGMASCVGQIASVVNYVSAPMFENN